LATTSAWLLHPLNLTPVLYVVQRMTSLSALFVILGLIAYAWGRLQMLAGRRGIPYLIAGICVAGPFAILSKENGALLPLYMGLLELTVFRLRGATIGSRRAILIFFGLVLALPALWLVYRIAANPGLITGGYGLREFTLTERLLTEARALWFYMRLVLLPDPSQMGLYHDDFGISSGWLGPPTTLFAVLGLAALLALGWTLRRRAPLVAFGILFFLAGHSMESTVIPLELVHEHRNYLPGYGLLLALFASVLRPDGLPLLSLRQGAAIVYVLLLAVSTTFRAADWGDPLRLTVTWAQRQPASARAQYEAGRVYAQLFAADPDKNPELYARARRYMLAAANVDPHDAVGLAGLVVLHWHADRPLEPRWLAELERRLASSPIRPASALIFEAFIRCRRSPDCPLDHATTVRLFEAAATNPRAGSARRAHLYDLYARYYAEAVGEPTQALDHLHRATKLAPGQLQHRINLIELLMAYGQTEAARTQLQTAQEQDRWHAFGPKLTELETRLSQMETATP
jgi:tetratricopeptide (TPR) repeat protein